MEKEDSRCRENKRSWKTIDEEKEKGDGRQHKRKKKERKGRMKTAEEEKKGRGRIADEEKENKKIIKKKKKKRNLRKGEKRTCSRPHNNKR